MYTLEETSLAFSAWRSNKENKGCKIPEDLWHGVQGLLPHYKKSQICKALQISGSQLNKRCLPLTAPKEGNSKDNGFAEAALANLPQRDLCELTLQGTRKTLSLKIQPDKLAYLLPLLEPYL